MDFPSPVVELEDCQLNWESMQSIVDTFNSRLSVGLYQAGDIKVTFAIAAPTGWLLLTGQTINPIQTVYPDLATAMGVTGSITFPDCRGRAIIGAGTGSGLTARTIRSTGGTEPSNMPSHNHGGATGTMSANASHSHFTNMAQGIGGGGFDGNWISMAGPLGGGAATTYGGVNGANTDHVHSISAQSVAGDNMMPFVAANIMLRVVNN